MVDNALAIASFVTGILLGLFLLGHPDEAVGQRAAFVGMLAGVAAVSFVEVRHAARLALVRPRRLVDGLRSSASPSSPSSPRRPQAGARTARMTALDDRDRCAVASLCSLLGSPAARRPARGRAGRASGSTRRGSPGSTTSIDAAIAAKAVPGGGRAGRPATARSPIAKAFGHRAVEPAVEPMTRDTVFDMASLTKPVATATSAMILLEQGKLRLDDPLGRHLPEFDNHGKGAITVEQLLRHRAGLIADNPIGDFADGPAKAWERIAAIGLESPARASGSVYSDVGFMILGRLVERVSGEPLDAFARENVFEPLGMTDTGFLPGREANRSAGSPRPSGTAGTMLRGVVHDPRPRALGGVAGHAGLFSTADDLAVYAQMLLDGGVGRDGRRVLAPADRPAR